MFPKMKKMGIAMIHVYLKEPMVIAMLHVSLRATPYVTARQIRAFN